MKKSLRLVSLLGVCALLSNCALCIPVRTPQDGGEDDADMSAGADLGESGSGDDMSPSMDMRARDMRDRVDMMTPEEDMSTQPDLSPPLTKDFVTTWDTRINGDSQDRSIEIPFLPGEHDFVIDWEDDGVFDEDGVGAPLSHEYASPGVYTVRIKGSFPGLSFGLLERPEVAKKLISVDTWGDNTWTTMEGMFEGCASFQILARDAPDLSNVTSMKDAFRGARELNSNIAHWDVSDVTDMEGLFYECDAFDQPLNSWDVSSVTNMHYMFRRSKKFNQPLDRWDVSSVTNMQGMFSQIDEFDQPLDSWDVSNVTTMHGMFHGASGFDQSLGAWTLAEGVAISSLLGYTNISKANYDATLIGWYANPNTPDNLILGAGERTYCAGATARAKLIMEKGWEITDGGEDCP